MLDRIEELSIVCGMNQRYHQQEWSKWSCWSTWLAIIMALAALASMVATIMSFYRSRWNRTSLSLSVAAFAAAAIVVWMPFSTWALEAREMFGRWSDLRVQVDLLLEDADPG